ncbi:MAG: hypothetical protein KUG80_02415 [Gammaproteobacteria bacterium]|nr:hypothetical protein [Gammaproteobacteria bacterium]
MLNTNLNRRYAITEQKKAELDALETAVKEGEYKVEQLQSVVSSLQDKSTEFTGFLTDAENSKEIALTNYNLVKSVANTVNELKHNANIVKAQTSNAENKLKITANNVAELIKQLIFSSEIIDKLAQLIIKKKSLNVLISDELVTIINTATTDANEAVAATLLALKSCYAAMATGEESMDISALEYKQSMILYQLLTGSEINENKQQFYGDLAIKELAVVDERLKSVKSAENAVLAALNTDPKNTVLSGSVKTEEVGVNASISDIDSLESTLTKANSDVSAAEKDVATEEESVQKELDAVSSNEQAVTNDQKVWSNAKQGKNKDSISDAKNALDQSKDKLSAAQTTLNTANKALKDKKTILANKRSALDKAKQALKNNQNKLDSSEKNLGKAIDDSLQVAAPVCSVVSAKANLKSINALLNQSIVALDKAEQAARKNPLDATSPTPEQTNAQTELELRKSELARNNSKLVQAKASLALSNQVFSDANDALSLAVKRLDSAIIQLNETSAQQASNALEVLLHKAYLSAVEKYGRSLVANNGVTKELDDAEANLSNATTQLNSTKAGLDAATAAALAA